MIYCYYIANGLASLHKMHTNGNDCDSKPVKIGRFSDVHSAKAACMEHYTKACKMAKAAGRAEPQILWM